MATVLFVDDEVAIRKAVSAWLTRKGHVVPEADTPAAARAVVAAEGDRLDGVFIDLRLQEESGVELYRWLESAHPELARRVTFMTGDLFDAPKLQAEHGSVLRKPFELAALEAHMHTWEGNGRG